MTRIFLTLALAIIASALLAACATGGPDDELKAEVVDNYADGVHHLYSRSLTSAQSMRNAIYTFADDPTPGHLEAAKRMWLIARDDYGPTEAFRFYDGPIDNPDDGPEGLINAWPMDESYVDYVEGSPSAGIINNPAAFPVIDAALIVSLNEEGGEENVSTGWHAIEFLLWGQDLSPTGPGARPVEDYTTNPNAQRRATYLKVASDTLVGHLQDMADAWAPGGGNYRARFVAMSSDDAIRDIITGIGELSRGELAGERMTVAYEERSQEDGTFLLLRQHESRHRSQRARHPDGVYGRLRRRVRVGNRGLGGSGRPGARQAADGRDSRQRQPRARHSRTVRQPPARGRIRPVRRQARRAGYDTRARRPDRHHRSGGGEYRNFHQRELSRSK